jgi:tRNA(Ile)-lysidine synthase
VRSRRSKLGCAHPTGDCDTSPIDLLARIDATIRRHALIEPGGEVLCLVSGGADSTCLVLALRELSYRAGALHINHGLRGAESDADARFCAQELDAEVVEVTAPEASEAALRAVRYAQHADALRATGHTASDQVETILYRLVSSGNTKGIKLRREDGVVRPLLEVWREETEAFCRERGVAYRVDSSNAATVRGTIRREVIPVLEQIHPGARANVLRSLEERRTIPPALVELLAAPPGTRRVDLGGGVQAVREQERLWLERGPVRLRGQVEWGGWRIRSEKRGLVVRGWRPGDRLAGRSKKIQDVFVDAKVPRSDREGWPLVVRGGEVIAVPGIVEAAGVEVERL